MLARKLRKHTKNLVNSIGKLIAKTKLSPNFFSLLSVVFAFITAYFIIKNSYLMAALFLLLTGLLDAIDGAVARASKKATLFGNYFDAVIDRVVEIIIYLGFALSNFALEAFLALSGGLLLSYAKPRTALVIKIDNRDWPGIGDKADKIFILTIGLIAANFYPLIYNISTISLLLIFMAAITYIGALQRILYAKKLINSVSKKT
jgi:archaetidylinositol phosphate synthase